MNQENLRLKQDQSGKTPWKKWGPYLTERQWGTVREDYSANGDAWDYISHDAARSRAYRWGEEGIGGISDDGLLLCFALAFWNRKDPILKERMFGLAGHEGNHGEDVKEYFYYLDNTPTHSYMKILYKYPQDEFPYAKLVEENQRRGKGDAEFELIDTGIFNNDRYFDIFIEYAKADAEDILIRISIHNRGQDQADLNVIPQIWFRNTWAWNLNSTRPQLRSDENNTIQIDYQSFSQYKLYFQDEPELLFCDNETNVQRLYGLKDAEGYFKDGINDYIVQGKKDAVNSEKAGTKAGVNYKLTIPANGSATVKLRLCTRTLKNPFQGFDQTFKKRIQEANEFYAEVQSEIEDADAKDVQRQAFAGMLWTKQFYYYNVEQWLKGDPGQPEPPPERLHGRNHEWIHLNNSDIISMPDNWEYPWYAAWDLAFHCIPLSIIDPEFAKRQLVLLTHEWYMHPNGELPAYEWEFSDVNPPVHAWATWRVFQIDRKMNQGKGDIAFLERVFHKLLLNFTWWVNRKDEDGLNIFQGGFLGLDNIGVFDRNQEIPNGGHLEQADGTSWMAMYCLNMMRIALELSLKTPVYQDLATKFFEHFLFIAGAMMDIGGEGINLWDDNDKYYYDVLHCPNGDLIPLRLRSIVGVIPLFAVETLEPEMLEKVPEFKNRLQWFLDYRQDLATLVSRWHEPGIGDLRLLSLLRGHRMKSLLKRMLDETEFLSDYGVRSLSRFHKDHPYIFDIGGMEFKVTYLPAESDSGMFGGNSNWRGPIWFPINYLIIESLQKFHHYYGDDFKIECPTGSGNFVTILDVANELSRRLTRIFLKDENGRRPVFGYNEKIQTDPHFRDYILFHEYFHGDTGLGVGASHQTGWTGLVAKLLQPRGK
jgi:hypothetical protein